MVLGFAQTSVYHDCPDISRVRFRVTVWYLSPVNCNAARIVIGKDRRCSRVPTEVVGVHCEMQSPQNTSSGKDKQPFHPNSAAHVRRYCEDIVWQEKLINPTEEAVYMNASCHVRAEHQKFELFQSQIRMLKEGRAVPFTRLSSGIYTITDRDLADGCIPKQIQAFHDLYASPPLYNSDAVQAEMAQVRTEPGAGAAVLSAAERFCTETMYIMASIESTGIPEDVVLCHITYNQRGNVVRMTPGFSEYGKTFRATTPLGVPYEYTIDDVTQCDEGNKPVDAAIEPFPLRANPTAVPMIREEVWSAWGEIESFDRTGVHAIDSSSTKAFPNQHWDEIGPNKCGLSRDMLHQETRVYRLGALLPDINKSLGEAS
ncbi:hypothetical protein TGME49_202255 [Toxoplasma gondii ME49]|uniref:Uncharacterized protein n=1 Tax=Toxoplasma gondii (strain ATCC 50611 / Me49) TaxID=508771 RepID=S8F675_TOXGM|nr:hypothetical protein TGME49_202255 [Toxoplasma gondii ME49]EPT30242.1 hypothetical protein TGME49_202255 [Toxoplasma gondii ME49]|eukprot:XP_018637410.1 hypothetical protein TGME49_202255 [Toxoplasma gondii ME49]